MPKFQAQIDTSKIPFKSPVMENATSNPSSPVEGQVYWKSDSNVLYVYDGSGWVTFYLSTTPLNSITAPSGDLSMNSHKIVSLTDPTSAQDAATKAYVDSVAQGLDGKPSVRVATTANITLSGTQTIDGIALSVNDRVLVKNQSPGSFKNNGIYTVQSSAWTRATDMDSATEIQGAFTFVEEGSTQGGSGWTAAFAHGGTLNVDDISWSQFSQAGSYIGGSGLTLTGLTFDVNVDNSSIEINADTLRVKASGITNAMLAGSIDLTSKVTGVLPVANGGTNASTAAAARASLVVTGFYETDTPALTANTYSSNITHGLGRRPVSVVFINNTTGEAEVLDWKYIDSNNIQILAGSAVSSAAYKLEVSA